MEAYRYFPQEKEEQDSFLSLQSNSVQFKKDTRQLYPDAYHFQRLYQKPAEICKPVGTAMLDVWDQRETADFSRGWRKKIQRYVASLGLRIKLMENEDTPAILKFLEDRYPPFQQKEICAFDLYRWRTFGHGVLLVDKHGEVRGTVFEIGYGGEEKASYTIRLAVAEDLSGKNLGFQVMLYSCLLAMEKGCRVKRGIIHCCNNRSLYINLNHVGWICDGIEADISQLGTFYHIALPLNPYSLISNQVDSDKVMEFMKTHQQGVDYELFPACDVDQVQEMFSGEKFKLAAFLKKSDEITEPSLFALSNHHLAYRKVPGFNPGVYY